MEWVAPENYNHLDIAAVTWWQERNDPPYAPLTSADYSYCIFDSLHLQIIKIKFKRVHKPLHEAVHSVEAVTSPRADRNAACASTWNGSISRDLRLWGVRCYFLHDSNDKIMYSELRECHSFHCSLTCNEHHMFVQ